MSLSYNFEEYIFWMKFFLVFNGVLLLVIDILLWLLESDLVDEWIVVLL